MKSKGIKQQKEDTTKEYETMDFLTKKEFLKFLEYLNNKPVDVSAYERRMRTIIDSNKEVSKIMFDSFLDEVTSNAEYPDDMEIFTVDRGWHKVKDYR